MLIAASNSGSRLVAWASRILAIGWILSNYQDIVLPDQFWLRIAIYYLATLYFFYQSFFNKAVMRRLFHVPLFALKLLISVYATYQVFLPTVFDQLSASSIWWMEFWANRGFEFQILYIIFYSLKLKSVKQKAL